MRLQPSVNYRSAFWSTQFAFGKTGFPLTIRREQTSLFFGLISRPCCHGKSSLSRPIIRNQTMACPRIQTNFDHSRRFSPNHSHRGSFSFLANDTGVIDGCRAAFPAASPVGFAFFVFVEA